MILLEQAKYKILNGPTPLQRLNHLEKKLNRSQIYVKRDDLIEVALGGNKLRSLEFWLGDAIAKSADIILVAGAPISNQCRLTAAAASIAGLDCLIFHNANEDAISQKQSFLNQLLGATVEYLGPVDEEERHRLVKSAAENLKAQGRKPYIINNAAIGALGYVLAAEELYMQSKATNADIRHVVLSGSMGPTEAGFIFGNHLLGSPFDVHLISVEYEKAELLSRIDVIFSDISKLTGLCPEGYEKERLHIHMGSLGDGYNQPTPASERAIITFARCEGIFLEHTYTAKTFAGFLDLIQTNYIPEGDAACVIHTGGVASLFSQFDMFKTL